MANIPNTTSYSTTSESSDSSGSSGSTSGMMTTATNYVDTGVEYVKENMLISGGVVLSLIGVAYFLI